MSSPLRSAQAKVNRARDHVSALEAAIADFNAIQPYVIGTKRDPETRRLIYYMARVLNPPSRLAILAGDVLQCLRTALDHLAYQLVRAGLRRELTEREARDVAFPIAPTSQDVQRLVRTKLKGANRQAQAAIELAQPYKGGQDTFWVIHRLNNIDKHRLLLTVGSAFQSVNLAAHVQASFRRSFPDWADVDIPPTYFNTADRMCPLQEGDELLIDGPDAEPVEDMGFRFEVAFNEPDLAEGQPLLETLKRMVEFIDRVMRDFEPLLS